MRLEVVLPAEFPALDPARPAEIARLAEELGYETAYLPDHILPPEPYGQVYAGVYEPLVTLAFVAAKTSRIRLGTSVLVVPLRDPFVLAKQVATLDALSGHRLVFGVGAGWSAPEFAEVNSDFPARGRRTDETLELLTTLFSTGRGPDGGYFEPRPEAPIPVLVGGNSTAGLRRAAALGDVWQSAGLDPARFGERVRRLRELAGDRVVRTSARMSWTGDDLERAIADARAYEAAGADALTVHFGAEKTYADKMAAFAAALAAERTPTAS